MQRQSGITAHYDGYRTADLSIPACKADGAETGERMLVWCEGGPSMARADADPPQYEINVSGGTYVLADVRFAE